MSIDTTVLESFLSLPKGRGHISYRKMKDVGTIWLNNPSARNALSIQMMHQFLDVLNEVTTNCPRVLIIRGCQGHFCAGGDLRDVKEHLLSCEVGEQMSIYMNWVLAQFKKLDCFILVVIEGAAIGGGAELAMLGDFIIADSSAKIGFVQLKLGVTPGWGGAARLIQRVGTTKSIQILSLARVYSAKDALNLGLIDETTETLEDAIVDLVEELLSKPAKSMRNLVQWMKLADGEHESTLFKRTWASDEHVDALSLPKTRRG